VMSFELPQVDAATVERIEIELRLASGHRWTENEYELYLLPPASPGGHHSLQVSQGENVLTERLQQAGYSVEDLGAVLIATRFNESVAAHLERGNPVILLIDSEDALPAEWPIHAKVRMGTELDGRWFSNYNWIRPERPPFSNIAFGRILGFESKEVAPRYVLRGIEAADFEDVLSGITYGWLNQNSGLAVQAQVGKGKLLMTTYHFEQYRIDPYATHLLDALVRYVKSEDFQPRLRMPRMVSVIPS
jgi:hypothetical protein